MRYGVSSACFYPNDTIESIKKLQNVNIKYAETFLNTFSELNPEYISKLAWQVSQNEMELLALHPFSSGMETFFFASAYNTRFNDGLELYKKYFKVCKQLNINTMAFHGAIASVPFPFKKHCLNYLELRKCAKEYGVELCYENVVRCKCGTNDNILLLREYCKDDVAFVLDVKQMRRAKEPMLQMMNVMNGKIKHIHLSDCSSENDCILPGKGTFDNSALFTELVAQDFDGDIVIELYNDGFKNSAELYDALEYVKLLYNKIKGAKIK
ncbi:MAG: sugar phosphate isomerase/epimerase [Oscillospiraceae bacterium]